MDDISFAKSLMQKKKRQSMITKPTEPQDIAGAPQGVETSLASF